MMYKTNETVLHANYGICKISEITRQVINGSSVECYTVKPLYDNQCRFLIAANNQKATQKIQRVLSRRELEALIQTMSTESTIWIENATLRKKRYEEILENGDRQELVQLIKTLYLRQQTLQEKGKKLQTADERSLQMAEKLLHDEISHVLHIQRDHVRSFILHSIQDAAASCPLSQRSPEHV